MDSARQSYITVLKSFGKHSLTRWDVSTRRLPSFRRKPESKRNRVPAFAGTTGTRHLEKTLEKCYNRHYWVCTFELRWYRFTQRLCSCRLLENW